MGRRRSSLTKPPARRRRHADHFRRRPPEAWHRRRHRRALATAGGWESRVGSAVIGIRISPGRSCPRPALPDHPHLVVKQPGIHRGRQRAEHDNLDDTPRGEASVWLRSRGDVARARCVGVAHHRGRRARRLRHGAHHRGCSGCRAARRQGSCGRRWARPASPPLSPRPRCGGVRAQSGFIVSAGGQQGPAIIRLAAASADAVHRRSERTRSRHVPHRRS